MGLPEHPLGREQLSDQLQLGELVQLHGDNGLGMDWFGVIQPLGRGRRSSEHSATDHGYAYDLHGNQLHE